MPRRSLLVLVLLVLAAMVAGCSSDAPSIGDPGFDLDKWLADNGVVKMVAGPDGVEWGSATSGADGTAKFYSPAHKGIFQLTTVDDKNATAPGMRVSVGATATTASYVVLDDSGQHAPMMWNGPIDGQNQNVTVEAADLQGANGDGYVYTPGASPFSTQFTLLGLEFTISIQAVLTGAALSVVGMVMKELVENTCLFFAPLHHDACAIAGDVTSAVTGLVLAGIPTALEEGVATPQTQRQVPDSLDVSDFTFTDNDPHPAETMTPTGSSPSSSGCGRRTRTSGTHACPSRRTPAVGTRLWPSCGTPPGRASTSPPTWPISSCSSGRPNSVRPRKSPLHAAWRSKRRRRLPSGSTRRFPIC